MRGEVGDVGRDELRRGAALGDPGERRFGIGVALQIVDHEIEAGLGERERDALADPAAPAGDQRNRASRDLRHGLPTRAALIPLAILNDTGILTPACST